MAIRWLSLLVLPALAVRFLRPSPLKPTELTALPAQHAGQLKAEGKHKKTKFQATKTKRVYCTPNKARLFEAIPGYIWEGDNIFCIGLDVETLDLLASLTKTGKVVQVDMDHGVPNAPKPGPGVTELIMDAWDVGAIQGLGMDFTVAVLDIGQWSGRDSLLDSLSLLQSYWQGFPSLRLIVCKSKALLQMSQRVLDSGLLQPGQKRQRQFLGRPDDPAKPMVPENNPECLLTVDKVVCAVGVMEYRATIPFVVREGDHVLEIGCQAGLTTKLIWQANKTGRVVGSDIGPSSIEHAKRMAQGQPIEWVVLDAWDLHAIQALGQWTVLYVDVSGISGRNSVLDAVALLFSYFRLLPQLRTVVVKSRSMRDLAGRFTRLDPIVEKPSAA